MWPCYWVLGCRCGYWIILRGWLSGLSDRHAGFYWTRCCRFEFHIGQFVACMNIAIWTNCCSKTWQTDYTQSVICIRFKYWESALLRFTLHNQVVTGLDFPWTPVDKLSPMPFCMILSHYCTPGDLWGFPYYKKYIYNYVIPGLIKIMKFYVKW